MKRRLARFAAWLRKAALFLVILVVGVAVGKVVQGLAVDQFGARLGFDLASAVGLVPYAALLIYLSVRFPRRRAPPRQDGKDSDGSRN